MPKFPVELQIGTIHASNPDGTVSVAFSDGETIDQIPTLSAGDAAVFHHDFTLTALVGGGGGGIPGPAGPPGPAGAALPAPRKDNPVGYFTETVWTEHGPGIQVEQNERCLITVGGIFAAGIGTASVSFVARSPAGIVLPADDARSVFVGVDGTKASNDSALRSLIIATEKTFMVFCTGQPAGPWHFTVATRVKNGLSGVQDPWIVINSAGV